MAVEIVTGTSIILDCLRPAAGLNDVYEIDVTIGGDKTETCRLNAGALRTWRAAKTQIAAQLGCTDLGVLHNTHSWRNFVKDSLEETSNADAA